MVKKYVMMVVGLIVLLPFKSASTTLFDLTQDLEQCIDQLAELEKSVNPDGTILLKVTDEYKDRQQLIQLGMPFYSTIFGLDTKQWDITTQDPATLKKEMVEEYKRLFLQYEKLYGTKTDWYETLEFGNLFLRLLLAKNILRKNILMLQVGTAGDIEQSMVTPELLIKAQTFQACYKAFQLFVRSMSSRLENGVSVTKVIPVLQGYSSFNTYANKIIGFQMDNVTQAVSSENAADNFIRQNFGDSALVSSDSFADLKGKILLFKGDGANKKALYSASDTYYAVYEMWAAYVPLRYYELLFLNDQNKEHANLFMGNFPSAVKDLHQVAALGLSEPYLTQYNDLMIEFQMVYQIAKSVVQKK